MDRRRRAARTVALMSLFTMADTQTDVPIASFVGDGSDLVSLSVAIEPIQDLHGYDNPWPAGGGKNLLTALPSPGTTVWFCEPDGFLFKANQTYCFSIGDGVTVGSYSIYAADKTTQLAYASSYRKVTYTPTVDTVGYPRLYAGNGVSQEAINSAQLELGNNRTTFAPYSNICPISGWTEANIHVSPTTDAADGTTYSITFPTSAGTVYGGTLDVTTGKLTVDRAIVDMGTPGWAHQAGYFYAAIEGIKQTTTTSEYPHVICSSYKTVRQSVWANNKPCVSQISGGNVILVGDDTYDTAADFKAAVAGQTLCYELATPIVYDLTPTQVITLIGTNNIWADTGDIKYIEYNI